MIYSVELRDKATVLAWLKRDAHVLPSPDTGYRFVAGGEQLQGHDANKRPVRLALVRNHKLPWRS